MATIARRNALRPSGIRSTPVRMDRVFEEPDRLLELVRSLAPYPTVGAYYNGGIAIGDTRDPPWFLLEPEVDWLIHNPHWISAAHQAFNAEIVRPIRCVVNLNPPAPAGPPHLDLPVFRGFSAPEFPIWLLMSMGRSQLFFDWLVPLASGVAWFWRGQGGEFEYWPEGLSGQVKRESAPLWNIGVMSDNEVMWHRVAAIGTPERQAEHPDGVAGTAKMHWLGSGWEARDEDRFVARYSPEEVRVSLVWKGYVFKDEAHLASFEDRSYDLDLDQVLGIFSDDLLARDLPPPQSADILGDPVWRRVLEETYKGC